ncbi:MAG TPA: response regulator [Bacteroidota bacterium]|nr:response regulator [Bacteroidota bacterium]
MTIETDSNRRAISELLKSADRAIKENNLDGALGFIDKVFGIEQRNVYARAYRERILALKEAEAKERAMAEKQAQAAPPPKPTPVAEKKKSHETAEVVAEKKTPPVAPPPAPGTKPRSASALHLPHSPAALEAYRTLLTEIWADGNVTVDEQSQIDSMTETFAITEKEHTEIERQVRIEAYLNAIREAWRLGITSFVDIRKRFRISDQEHLSVEEKINQFLQSLKVKGTVLLLDDDNAFLSVVKDLLSDSGFTCVAVNSGEDGLKVLESVTPDIVVCDIDFVKPKMNGFTFFEKFRAIDRLIDVPFIFMSGLDQDIVIRAGKQMGVDDYLTKPFDAEMLIATIEGKLKRSREIKRIKQVPKI